MSKQSEVFSLIKDDGTVKTKEDFIKEMEKFYEQAVDVPDSYKEGDLFRLCTNPLTQINPEESTKTFDFINRVIRINEDITDKLAKEVITALQFWSGIDDFDRVSEDEREPISIMIDTCGGSMSAAYAIYDAICLCPTPVITWNCGKAWSAGFIIFLAGKYRVSFPNSYFLFHQGSGGFIGDAQKCLQHADFYKRLLKDMKNIVLEKTKITNDEYESHINDDWWISTDEAIRYGIADEIAKTSSILSLIGGIDIE